MSSSCPWSSFKAKRRCRLSIFLSAQNPPPAELSLPVKFIADDQPSPNSSLTQLRLLLAMLPHPYMLLLPAKLPERLIFVAAELPWPPSSPPPWPAYSGCSHSFLSLVLRLPLCRDAHKQTGCSSCPQDTSERCIAAVFLAPFVTGRKTMVL